VFQKQGSSQIQSWDIDIQFRNPSTTGTDGKYPVLISSAFRPGEILISTVGWNGDIYRNVREGEDPTSRSTLSATFCNRFNL
jgi:hypothetical protein